MIFELMLYFMSQFIGSQGDDRVKHASSKRVIFPHIWEDKTFLFHLVLLENLRRESLHIFDKLSNMWIELPQSLPNEAIIDLLLILLIVGLLLLCCVSITTVNHIQEYLGYADDDEHAIKEDAKKLQSIVIFCQDCSDLMIISHFKPHGSNRRRLCFHIHRYTRTINHFSVSWWVELALILLTIPNPHPLMFPL